MRHYREGEYPFDLLRAYWIGDREPLTARLRNPAITLSMAERETFAQDFNRQVKWPRGGPRSVAKRKAQLKVVATFFEFRLAKRLKYAEALTETAKRCGLKGSPETVNRRIEDNKKFAKKLKPAPEHLEGWTWWQVASRLARKNKIDKLHRTY